MFLPMLALIITLGGLATVLRWFHLDAASHHPCKSREAFGTRHTYRAAPGTRFDGYGIGRR